MSVVIRIDGTDITDDVVIRTASFSSLVNGAPGQALLRVKDVAQTYGFASGGLLTLDVDSVRVWGGFVMSAKKVYALSVIDTTDPPAATRMWEIVGADHNILFGKRIVFKESDPTGKINFSYDADTYDDTIIDDIFDNYLDIAGDGLTKSGVTRIAKVILDVPGKTHRGLIASAGFTWKQMMDSVQRATGGIYYLDASRDLKYVDVETSTSDYTLTDQPAGAFDVGFQSFTLLENGSDLVNDMMVWGAGNGSSNYVFSRTQDSSSIAEHGTWQLPLVTAGIFRQASADIVADSYVYGTPQSHRGGKDDAVSFSARVFEPRFAAGDVVDVVCGIFDYTDALPVRRMTITFLSPTEPIFDLILSHAIDQPVGLFEFIGARIDLPPLPGIDVGPGIALFPPIPPETCPTGCLIASCRYDDFDRTVAAPDWGDAWTTLASSADGGGIVASVPNVADVATWNVTRSTTLLQEEAATRRLSLGSCADTPGPWDYYVAWTADGRFDSFEAYSNPGGFQPPGSYNFPGLLYEFDPGILTTVAQQFLQFWFVSTNRVSDGPSNPTLVRIAMDAGGAFWGVGNGGLSTSFSTPTAFTFVAGHRYMIHLRANADGTTYVNMWDADAVAVEPSGWMITRSSTSGTETTNRPSLFGSSFVRGIASGSLASDPDDDDFTFDPVKIDLVCGDFATQIVQFEDFENRSYANTAHVWGNANPSNKTWTLESWMNSTQYVADGYGIFRNDTAPTVSNSYMEVHEPVVPVGSDWHVLIPIHPTAGDTGAIAIAFIINGIFFDWFDGGSHPVPLLRAEASADPGDPAEVEEDFPFPTFWSDMGGRDAIMEAELVGGSLFRMRLYDPAGSIPDWQLTMPATPFGPIPDVYMQVSGHLTSALVGFKEWRIGEINPQYPTRPCDDVATVPIVIPVALTGEVCETISHSGGTDFATARAFFSGSLDVWVNGTQQTNFTFTAVLGEFSLSASIDATDELRVCYRANGDPI